VAALIALVGGLGLAGTMSLSVMERTREIGVMRAVGAETPDLRTMFIVEGLFIGLLSALISFVLSIPLTDLIGRALGSAVRLGAIEVLVNQTGYGLWLLIVSVVSVVASIAPARRAGKISIREALAYA
jgi:putative ABC transport system permease protein